MKPKLAVLLLLIYGSIAHAQERPFLYSVSIPQTSERRVILHFDAGWGAGSLGSSESTAIDRRFGAIWQLNSRWTVLANAGFGNDLRSSTTVTGKAEAFYGLMRRSEHGFSFDVGGGFRWENEEGGVAMLHAISGWRSPKWMLESNFILEKANSSDRDPIDLIFSFGWLYHCSSNIGVGVEAVGQDLEGFWELQEAEGGARILLGPSMHLNVSNWEAAIGGGYVFRPTMSARNSAADRAFGSERVAVQVSLGRSF